MMILAEGAGYLPAWIGIPSFFVSVDSAGVSESL